MALLTNITLFNLAIILIFTFISYVQSCMNNRKSTLYYQSPQGVIFGPYSQDQMYEWYSQGYFDDTTPISWDPIVGFYPISNHFDIKASHEVQFAEVNSHNVDKSIYIDDPRDDISDDYHSNWDEDENENQYVQQRPYDTVNDNIQQEPEFIENNTNNKNNKNSVFKFKLTNLYRKIGKEIISRKKTLSKKLQRKSKQIPTATVSPVKSTFPFSSSYVETIPKELDGQEEIRFQRSGILFEESRIDSDFVPQFRGHHEQMTSKHDYTTDFENEEISNIDNRFEEEKYDNVDNDEEEIVKIRIKTNSKDFSDFWPEDEDNSISFKTTNKLRNFMRNLPKSMKENILFPPLIPAPIVFYLSTFLHFSSTLLLNINTLLILFIISKLILPILYLVIFMVNIPKLEILRPQSLDRTFILRTSLKTAASSLSLSDLANDFQNFCLTEYSPDIANRFRIELTDLHMISPIFLPLLKSISNMLNICIQMLMINFVIPLEFLRKKFIVNTLNRIYIAMPNTINLLFYGTIAYIINSLYLPHLRRSILHQLILRNNRMLQVNSDGNNYFKNFKLIQLH